ncbi:MAG: hypothetical protein LQ351_001263 [Letrouitia transgressa]|nr:MAG: hypothetical protein LQ351_001263 [Letrouitia transgressa]
MYGRLNRPQHFQETIPETNVSYDPAFAEISGKELMPAELPSPDPSELPDPEWLNWLEMSTETTHSTTGIVDTPPSVTASAPSPTSVPQEVGLKRNIEPTESFSFGYGRHPSSGGTFGSTIQENSPKMKIDIQPQPVKDQLIMTVGDRTHHQYHRSQSSPVQTSPYHSSAGATQEDHLNDEWASSIPDNRSNLEFGLEQKNSVITHQRRAKHTGNALHISGHSDSAYHRQAEINHLKAWQQHPKRMLALYNRDYSQVEATEVNRENMIHSQEEHRAVGPEFNGQIYRHQSDTATYDGFPQSYQQNGNSPDNSLFGKEPNVSQPSHPLASTTSSHPAKLLHRRTSSTKKVGRCPYCGQEFSDGSNLRRHIQNLHQRHWKYICPEKCGYESWRRDNVSKHCDRRHGYKLPRLKGNQRKLHKNLTVSDTPLMVDSSLNADVDRIGIDAKVFFP